MSDNKAVQRFFANSLMGVGALITVLCGGCTALFLGWGTLNGLLMGIGHGNIPVGLGLYVFVVLIVGGLPTAVGVGMFFLGRVIERGADVSREPEVVRPRSLDE